MSTLRSALRAVGHSLSARLLLVFFLGSVAYGYAARFSFALFQDTDYLRQIIGAHIALHSDYILEDIGAPPDISKAQAIVDKIPVDIRIVGPGLDWSSSPDFYPLADVPFGPISILDLGEKSRTELEAWARKIEGLEVARYDDHFLIKLQDEGYEVVFASPRISEKPGPDFSTLIIAVIGVAVLFLCYLSVRWVFRPIKWMQEGTARIAAGDLDYRIPTPRNDELGDLSRAFNNMTGEVQDMLEAKRQLMLAISHELRSPLTRSKVSAEFVEDEAVRKSILEDIGEMERLITDLLESEALNTRHAVLRREPVDIGELLESVVEMDFSSKADRIRVQAAAGIPLAELDVTRIRLLVRNLVDNALRYNPADAAPVEVSARLHEGQLQISVRDQGPGISLEHIDKVTEPFYRADPARARSTGGFGLGLYLCKRIVEAHRGTFKVASPGGRGTLVTVTLPLK